MSLLLTSFLLSLVAALWVWMAGRKDPQGRPWLTVLCMGMLLILPLLTLLPKFQWEVIGVVTEVAGNDQPVGSSWTLWSWLMLIWSVGAGMMFVRLIHGQRVLARWMADSLSIDDQQLQKCLAESAAMLGLEDLPAIRTKKDLRSPVVAGLLNPVILIPSSAMQWPKEVMKMAILHELGHVQRKDLWIRMAADVTCAIHFYNPLVWWMKAKLLTQCEYACDARVIASGANPKSYISALCDVVESAMKEQSLIRSRPIGVCAMADHAPLKMRVNRLLDGRRASNPWLAVVAAVLTTATALGMTLVRPVVKHAEESIQNETPQSEYSKEEIDLRHSANPFPGS